MMKNKIYFLSIVFLISVVKFSFADDIEDNIIIGGDDVTILTTNEPEVTEKPTVKISSRENSNATMRGLLLKNLLKDFDKRVRPDDLTVQFAISLLDFQVIEEDNAIEALTWIRMAWKDERLAYDKDFYGVEALRVPPSEMWKPDILLYNTAEPVGSACQETNVLIYPNGKVLWVPPCRFKALCQTSEFNLNERPYGLQKCFLKFGSWTHDGYSMNLIPYGNKENALDMTDYFDNHKWKIVSTATERHERFYPCCSEPYMDMQFNITFQRKPEFNCPN